MVRKLVGVLALVALLATGASAQTPFQQSFTFVGSSGSNGVSGTNFDTYCGAFNGPVNAQAGELAYNSLSCSTLGSTAFQIWCVDPMQFVSTGQSYTAWVTPLNTTTTPNNFNHTLDELSQAPQSGVGFNSGFTISDPNAQTAANAQVDYRKAAYLASQMTLANSTQYEEAIWYVMGFQGFRGYTDPSVIALANGITVANLNSVQLNEWGVISNGLSNQEFIYHHTSGTTQSVTPEPTTVSLLAMGFVGMAGTSLRRRKRKQ